MLLPPIHLITFHPWVSSEKSKVVQSLLNILRQICKDQCIMKKPRHAMIALTVTTPRLLHLLCFSPSLLIQPVSHLPCRHVELETLGSCIYQSASPLLLVLLVLLMPLPPLLLVHWNFTENVAVTWSVPGERELADPAELSDSVVLSCRFSWMELKLS